MAETIVNLVLRKLADVAVKKVLLIHRVDKQVEKVSRELERIQAFLKDADRKKIADERQKNWVKEIRDVAHSIEDAIDTFLMEIPQNPQKSSKREAIKNFLRKTTKLPAVHKLVDEMKQIQEKMKEIEESRVRYGINNLGEGSGDIRLPVRPMVLPDIDPDIVGFKDDQDRIVKELLDETTKRRSVVSICGTGGLGKTTLAQKVYNCNDVKGQFEVHIWIAISEKFEVIDVSRKIARKLELPIRLTEQPNETEVILTEIHKSLRGKKYLIVLDDVWTTDLWSQISAAFPDENNGSRVVVTTRFADVPKDMDPTSEPYKLQVLTEELSRELLLKTIFPNHDPKKSSFDDLSDILGQFIHKCGGLPLALVVLGGLLKKQTRSHAVWSTVFRTMRWHVEGKNCSEIIGTSYEDLPFALKSCFMYFAAFPEDYEIDAQSLLRMWIAEGFIPLEDNRTLEETAESFLEDLVQRSMVQVYGRSLGGSIRIIRIHDLLRDLAIQKAKDDNFLLVYSHPNDKMRLSRARRVAIHKTVCGELVMSQNLHSLVCFYSRRMPDCSKQRLLKVVSFQQDLAYKIELGMFLGLTQVRYLSLRGTVSDDRDQEFYENVIGRMKFLQTFDVLILPIYSKPHFTFPKSAWNIKTLRHVFFYMFDFKLLASAKLTNLQTIQKVRAAGQSWEIELPHIPNLRSLNIDINKSSPSNTVVTFLSTLEHLTNLVIEHDDSVPDMFDMRGFPFYQHLQSLEIVYSGSTTLTLHEDMLPCHLISLSLMGHKFQQDIMPIMERLRCLKVLYITDACKSKKMSCSSGGFSQLEELALEDLSIEEWEIEEGAMPILKNLSINVCDELGVPQGLQYLTNLQTLAWPLRDNAKADLIRNLCQHVPSIDLEDYWETSDSE